MHFQQGTPQSRQHLPILPSHLRQIRMVWGMSPDPDALMLWAAATLTFFGFFRSDSSLSRSVQPYWGDVSVDSQVAPTRLKVHLKVSKCDWFGQGVNVFIGHTEDDLCPVVAVLNYIAQRGDQPGPFFHISLASVSQSPPHLPWQQWSLLRFESCAQSSWSNPLPPMLVPPAPL